VPNPARQLSAKAWCRGRDSNPHVRRHLLLRQASIHSSTSAKTMVSGGRLELPRALAPARLRRSCMPVPASRHCATGAMPCSTGKPRGYTHGFLGDATPRACLAGGRACALSPSRLCRLPVALAALVGSKNFGGDGGNRTHVLPLCRRQPEPSRRHPQEFSCQCSAGNRCRTPTPAKEFEDQYGIRTRIFAVCGKYKLLSLDSAERPHCQLCAPGLICDGGSRTRTRLLQAV
jgi:hypothetical protein